MTNITNSTARSEKIEGESSSDLSQAIPQHLRDFALLENINACLEQLGSSARYIKLPAISDNVLKALSDKKILMVDDNRNVLEKWMPELVAATKGKAEMYWHNQDKSANRFEVINAIAVSHPDIILLDYELSHGITGSDLIASLREKLPQAIIIGFSSDSEYNARLEKAGAQGSAPKSRMPEETFLDIIAYVESAEKAAHEKKTIIDPENNLLQTLTSSISAEQVEAWIDRLCQHVRLKESAAEFLENAYSEERARELGSKLYKKGVSKLLSEDSKPFEKLMIALGDMPYYDSQLRQALIRDREFHNCTHEILEELKNYLPEKIRQVIAEDKIVNGSFQKDNFALLLDKDGTRRIITNDKLIQLSDVCGYSYLDLSITGDPFTRSVTSREGGRAFFDGKRLMAHPSFQTCAPKVSFFDGGYVVNSTECSIINGKLYPLISEVDAVARTHGAGPYGMLDFNLSEALSSYQMNDALAKYIKISADGVVELPNRRISPIGEFQDSLQTKLANGFTHYEWSEFKNA